MGERQGSRPDRRRVLKVGLIAIPPGSIGPTLLPGEDGFDGFARYGFRVPFALVSPWARSHFVSHEVYDHTSILKLVEVRWNLPALLRAGRLGRNQMAVRWQKTPSLRQYAGPSPLARRDR